MNSEKEYIDKYWKRCRGYCMTVCDFHYFFTKEDWYQIVSLYSLLNKWKSDEEIKEACLNWIRECLWGDNEKYITTKYEDWWDFTLADIAEYKAPYHDYRKVVIGDMFEILNNEEKIFLDHIFGLTREWLWFRWYSNTYWMPYDKVVLTMKNIRKKIKDKIKATTEDILC